MCDFLTIPPLYIGRKVSYVFFEFQEGAINHDACESCFDAFGCGFVVFSVVKVDGYGDCGELCGGFCQASYEG